MKKVISFLLSASFVFGLLPAYAGAADAQSSGKTGRTIYTDEMVENARSNIEKHTWAQKLRDKAVDAADVYVENLDEIYSLIPGEGVPRSKQNTTRGLPDAYDYMKNTCPICEEKLDGTYPWLIDPINNPWKIQCPKCNALLPSNDFESFYKLGVDPATGEFDYNKAISENKKLIAAGQEGYLVNTLYPEKSETWMVDDGFGWLPNDTSGSGGVGVFNKSPGEYPKYTPIALYAHKFWDMNGPDDSFFCKAISELRDAYLYTGEDKYGIAGAILIDRVADVYPMFDLTKVSLLYENGDSNGKIVNSIWESRLAMTLIRAYDAFWPAMEHDEVINYLSGKASESGTANAKNTAELIRKNSEDGILREVFKALKNTKILGNTGFHQSTAALCAVALDTQPETDEIFDWLGAESVLTAPSGYEVYDKMYTFKGTTSNGTQLYQGFNINTANSGGELTIKYVNDVDRDGFGDEVAAGYNSIWIAYGLEASEVISHYDPDSELNLFNNPKFVKMFDSIIRETLGAGYTPHIGDYGYAGMSGVYDLKNSTLHGYNELKNTNPAFARKLAQNYYYLAKGNLNNAQIDIFTDNDGLKTEIQSIIDTYGKLEFTSDNLTGYGLGVLRDSANQADAWMYYGRTNTGHSHRDMLQLGIDAYGFNFTPDLGYPAEMNYDPNRVQWVSNTLSHNTVVVDGKCQNGIYGGTPLHFDDSGKVKLMDVRADGVYDNVTEYRRTAVSVAADDEVSYTVDFFRVTGGDEHIYSFHTQAHNGYTTDLELTAQNGGTYAGADVSYGADPGIDGNTLNNYETLYPRGYTWLDNVKRATPASGEFLVNFKQTDFRNTVDSSRDLNLKFYALNDWAPASIGLATGYPPPRSSNDVITGLDYMLIHRKGSNLDTLFTSVIEPYDGEEYIESVSSVSVYPADVEDVKAIKVQLKSGRTDYIVYATDNNVTYTVDNMFDFRGFVGVYSINKFGDNVYSYVNDGEVIGEVKTTSSVNGTVKSFTKGLSNKNTITVTADTDIDTAKLAGKYIYVNNTHSPQNGAYKIISATKNGADIVLDIGDVSPVLEYADVESNTFNYNISEGQVFEIPLPTSATEKTADIFGARSAFIRNISNTDSAEQPYSVILLSGINALSYGAVGFDVMVDGKVNSGTTSSVYEKIIAKTADADRVEVVPADFGGKAKYIFEQTFNFEEKYGALPMWFRPFAIDFDGNYRYGDIFKVDMIYDKEAK